jgi:hypothetical protein
MEETNCGIHWLQTCSLDGIDVVIQWSGWLEITLFCDAPLITLVGVGDPNINSWYYSTHLDLKPRFSANFFMKNHVVQMARASFRFWFKNFFSNVKHMKHWNIGTFLRKENQSFNVSCVWHCFKIHKKKTLSLIQKFFTINFNFIVSNFNKSHIFLHHKFYFNETKLYLIPLPLQL